MTAKSEAMAIVSVIAVRRHRHWTLFAIAVMLLMAAIAPVAMQPVMQKRGAVAPLRGTVR
jgi:hypothetical protein